jgi:hypothetical protein
VSYPNVQVSWTSYDHRGAGETEVVLNRREICIFLWKKEWDSGTGYRW